MMDRKDFGRLGLGIDDLIEAFVQAVLEGQPEPPSYFAQMLGEHGAVGAARLLINARTVSDGFTRLWELNRLDLTVEAFSAKVIFQVALFHFHIVFILHGNCLGHRAHY